MGHRVGHLLECQGVDVADGPVVFECAVIGVVQSFVQIGIGTVPIGSRLSHAWW